MTIKAVIFDLGNVLVDVDFNRALTALSRHLEREGPGLSSDDAQHLIALLECNELDARQFYERVCACGNYTVAFDRFCEIYCDMFEPVDTMIAAHAAIRRRGLPTYLFSNTSLLHFEHIRSRHRFMADFDDAVLSFRIGCMKPHPRSYEAVEGLTGARGEALVYIDDRVENVEGARRRGWHAVHHTVPSETIAQLAGLGLLDPKPA